MIESVVSWGKMFTRIGSLALCWGDCGRSSSKLTCLQGTCFEGDRVSCADAVSVLG